MRRFPFAAAALAAFTAISSAGAQTWQAIGTPSNASTGPYWNNQSDDNVGSAVCNVGAVLTNTPALSASSCLNQAPAVFLPLTPAPLTTSNVFLGGTGGASPGAFRFAAGTYNFSLVGRIEGNTSTAWGAITDDGTVLTAAQLASGSTTINGPFAIWITQALPVAGAGTVYTSALTTGTGAIGSRSATTNQQFAVFTNADAGLTSDAFGTLLSGAAGVTYYVGMEDNVNGGRGFGAAAAGAVSDRDYNDIIIRVSATTVPEPASMALLGSGMALLALFASRRKRA